MQRVETMPVQRVAAYARHHPEAQVIVGHGWDERAWPEPQPPTRTELDRAAGWSRGLLGSGRCSLRCGLLDPS